MKANEYQCTICGGIFETCWTEAEAQAEALREFGPIPKDKQLVVCDECYQMVKPGANPEVFREWLAQKAAEYQGN